MLLKTKQTKSVWQILNFRTFCNTWYIDIDIDIDTDIDIYKILVSTIDL